MATKPPLYPERQHRRRAMGWAVKIKANPEEVRIQCPPGKCGPSVPGGIVTFADDLAGEAESFQDNVIVHELLHRRHRDHRRQFKALMIALVPDCRDLEKQRKHSADRTLERATATGWAPDGND